MDFPQNAVHVFKDVIPTCQILKMGLSQKRKKLAVSGRGQLHHRLLSLHTEYKISKVK